MVNALNINKKRFISLAFANGIGLFTLLAILFFTGTGYAAFPITGVGGFVIEANKITGNNFTMQPKTGETELHENWGQASIELGNTTIDGLVLTKKISLDGALAEYGISNIEFIVTSDSSVGGNNVRLGVTGLVASHSDFRNLKVNENSRANEPLDVFKLEASSLTLDQPKLNTHFLSTAQMSIPQLKIDVIVND